MVGPIDVKRKGSESVGHWVQYVTLPFDLTHDLDLGCFKAKFRLGRPIDMERKGCESSIHDHDID